MVQTDLSLCLLINQVVFTATRKNVDEQHNRGRDIQNFIRIGSKEGPPFEHDKWFPSSIFTLYPTTITL